MAEQKKSISLKPQFEAPIDNIEEMIEFCKFQPSILDGIGKQIKNKMYAVKIKLEKQNELVRKVITYHIRSENQHFELKPTGTKISKEVEVPTYEDAQYDPKTFGKDKYVNIYAKKSPSKKKTGASKPAKKPAKKVELVKTKPIISLMAETKKHFAFILALFLNEIAVLLNDSDININNIEDLKKESFKDSLIHLMLDFHSNHNNAYFTSVEDNDEYQKKITNGYNSGITKIRSAIKEALSSCNHGAKDEFIDEIKKSFVNFMECVILQMGTLRCLSSKNTSLNYQMITGIIAGLFISRGSSYAYVDVVLSNDKFMKAWDKYRHDNKKKPKNKPKDKKDKEDNSDKKEKVTVDAIPESEYSDGLEDEND